MIRIIISLIVFSYFLTSCKKEDKTTPAPPPSYTGGGSGPSTSSFSIQSYPNTIGNQWVYSFYKSEVTSYNNTTTTYTNSYNYTVTVVADTIMPNNNTGKIWTLTFQNPLSNKRFVAYLDNTTNLFKIEEIEYSYNIFFYTTLSYPLTLNKSWENTGQMPLDTSVVTSQESNKLVVDRGYWILNGTYKYKLSNKGFVYSLYTFANVQGNQITITDHESTLISTNF
jgi:hypothetical protein